MTYPFGNVNIGSYADDGTGDPLRTAFNTINENFANIASGNVTLSAPVQSVAGRTGNVTLGINDILGAASFAYVANAVATANAYTDSEIAIVNANIVALNGNLSTSIYNNVIANVNIAGTNANVTAANTAIAALQANDVSQFSSINSINSSLVTVENTQANNMANIAALQSSVTTTNVALSTFEANVGSFYSDVTRRLNLDAEIRTKGKEIEAKYPGILEAYSFSAD